MTDVPGGTPDRPGSPPGPGSDAGYGAGPNAGYGAGSPTYPLSLSVDETDGPRNRLTAFFRLFVTIPIAIVLAAVSGGGWGAEGGRAVLAAAGGFLFAGPLLMILFRKKYPRWWFDWNLELLRFHTRVAAFFLLLRDEYPSTDEEQSVHLELVYPDAQTQLMRGMPIVKWLLAIPHYVVLFFLFIGVFFVAIASWFAVVVTGRLPRGMFDYQVGVVRWACRVLAYAGILTTDVYPPFSLKP
ncbi:MAG: DUF4389 domain-containing protein [Frankia sp.]